MEVNGTASAFSKCQADGRDRQISHCDNGKGMRLWSRVGRGAGFLLALTFKSSPERRAKSAFETGQECFRRAGCLRMGLGVRQPVWGAKTIIMINYS